MTGFVVVACAVSWAAWAPLAVRGVDRPEASWLQYLHLLGSLGPAVAALVMAALAREPGRLRRLIGRVLLWRVAAGWHGIAWLGPFALLIVAQTVAHLSGSAVLPGSIGRSPEYPELPLLLYWPAVVVFYGFGEEIGWRGFALPLLQARLHPFAATLVVAVVWAVWHAPLFLFSPGLAGLGPGGIAGWFASLVTGAFLMTWLFNRSGGSVPVVAGFHATLDIAFLGPSEVMMIVGALTTVAGAAALLLVAKGGGSAVRDPPGS